ncbi:MAG: hypothetical protein AB1757_09005 [Acidobacteriota bacterium]
MNVEQTLLEKFRILPTEKQLEALDFVEFLEQKTRQKQPRRSSLGICANLPINITAEEIDEARREMWKNFPREEFYEEDRQ